MVQNGYSPSCTHRGTIQDVVETKVAAGEIKKEKDCRKGAENRILTEPTETQREQLYTICHYDIYYSLLFFEYSKYAGRE